MRAFDPKPKSTELQEQAGCNAINWYRSDAVKKDLVCANEQYYLLRDGHHVCWSQANCDAFVDAAADLWNAW
jgi:hypothetical protein